MFVEDGIEMVVWIGQQAPPEFVMNVFGVNSQTEINVDSVRMCTLVYYLWVKIATKFRSFSNITHAAS